jgi:uncharacterized radical SAM superfamily Fe-S cluster-containing enzyme
MAKRIEELTDGMVSRHIWYPISQPATQETKDDDLDDLI